VPGYASFASAAFLPFSGFVSCPFLLKVGLASVFRSLFYLHCQHQSVLFSSASSFFHARSRREFRILKMGLHVDHV
jgi:hypothetical protein